MQLGAIADSWYFGTAKMKKDQFSASYQRC